MPRSAVERNVKFLAVDGSTLLQAGVVIDMSRDGLQLRTRQPAPVGAIIELEIEPRTGLEWKGPSILRGRVVRVQELGGGEYSAGIRLRYRQIPTHTIRPAGAQNAPAMSPTHAKKNASPRLWDVVMRMDWRPFAFTAICLVIASLLLLWPRETGSAAPETQVPDWGRPFFDRPAVERTPMPENKDGSAADDFRRDGDRAPAVPFRDVPHKIRERVSRSGGNRPEASTARTRLERDLSPGHHAPVTG